VELTIFKHVLNIFYQKSTF